MSPTVARSEMALWKLYLVDSHYGSLGYDGYHRWEILEGRYTVAVLFEYAGTLGPPVISFCCPRTPRTPRTGSGPSPPRICCPRSIPAATSRTSPPRPADRA